MSKQALVWISVTVLLTSDGCTSKPNGGGETCTPQCVSGCGGSDGCGGVCGCPQGQSCSATHLCVAPSTCTDTCAATGATCGDVCGQSCGTCGTATSCIDGKCLGSTDVGCSSCSLRLSLVDKQITNGSVKQVTLALDYFPVDGEPKPRLADFRLKSNRDINVIAAVPGDALVQASKGLYLDPVSNKPWRKRADGAFQFAALSTENTNRFAAGRVLTVTVELSASSASFFLQKRDLTFAPLEADLAIRTTPYDSPVVVVQ